MMADDTREPFRCPAQGCHHDRSDVGFGDEKRLYLHWMSTHKPRCPRTDCKYSLQDLSKTTRSYFIRHWATHFPMLNTDKSACEKCGLYFANTNNRDRHATKCDGGMIAAQPAATDTVSVEGMPDLLMANRINSVTPALDFRMWSDTAADINLLNNLPCNVEQSFHTPTISSTWQGVSLTEPTVFPPTLPWLVSPVPIPEYAFHNVQRPHDSTLPRSPWIEHLHIDQVPDPHLDAIDQYIVSEQRPVQRIPWATPTTDAVHSSSRKRAAEDTTVFTSKRYQSIVNNDDTVGSDSVRTYLGLAATRTERCAQKSTDTRLLSTSPASLTRLTQTGNTSGATELKGRPLHHCDCGKAYTCVEHLRRHQQNHGRGAFSCDILGCDRTFHRGDLLSRHKANHNDSATPSEPAMLNFTPLPYELEDNLLSPWASLCTHSSSHRSSQSSGVTIRKRFRQVTELRLSGLETDAGSSHLEVVGPSKCHTGVQSHQSELILTANESASMVKDKANQEDFFGLLDEPPVWDTNLSPRINRSLSPLTGLFSNKLWYSGMEAGGEELVRSLLSAGTAPMMDMSSQSTLIARSAVILRTSYCIRMAFRTDVVNSAESNCTMPRSHHTIGHLMRFFAVRLREDEAPNPLFQTSSRCYSCRREVWHESDWQSLVELVRSGSSLADILRSKAERKRLILRAGWSETSKQDTDSPKEDDASQPYQEGNFGEVVGFVEGEVETDEGLE